MTAKGFTAITLMAFSAALSLRADAVPFGFTGVADSWALPAFDSGLGELQGLSLNLFFNATLSLTFNNSTDTIGYFNGIFAPAVLVFGLPNFQILRGDNQSFSGGVDPFSSYTGTRNNLYFGRSLHFDQGLNNPWSLTFSPNAGPQAVYWSPGLGAPRAVLTLDDVQISGEWEYAANPVTENPEPSLLGVLALGLAGMVAIRSRLNRGKA